MSADVDTFSKLKTLIHQTGEHICLLKIHIDIIKDFCMENVQEILSICKIYQGYVRYMNSSSVITSDSIIADNLIHNRLRFKADFNSKL